MSTALIASSSLFMRIMLKQILETLNLEVVTGSNLKQIADSLTSVTPDLALVDLASSSVEDLEVTRLVKSRNPACAVIGLIPAKEEQPQLIVEMVRAGMDGYIKTPISPEQVRTRIEQSVPRSQ